MAAMTTVLTGVGIDAFQVARVAHGLSIEINTGMKMSRGSVMNLAKEYCGSHKQTKKGVLRDYVAWLKLVIPGYEPAETIVEAMAKPTK
jgi:hypothetical protein